MSCWFCKSDHRHLTERIDYLSAEVSRLQEENLKIPELQANADHWHRLVGETEKEKERAIASIKREQTEADLLKVTLDLLWTLVAEKLPVSHPHIKSLRLEQLALQQQHRALVPMLESLFGGILR